MRMDYNIDENRPFFMKTDKSVQTGFINLLKTGWFNLNFLKKNENQKNWAINQKNQPVYHFFIQNLNFK
jgi:hypothetical protein